MPATLNIPPLICFTLKKHPEDKSLGLQVRQGEDDAVEVVRISPGGPASLTPFQRGFEILSINDHRIRDAQRCVDMLKFYTKKGLDVEIVASAGARPPGALYVMVKRENANKPLSPNPGDGSFQGLFLEDNGGRVRVSGFGESGLLIGSKINKGDILLSLDGRPVHSIDDCRRALKKVTRSLIPILTYNLFRKFRSGILVEPTSSRVEPASAPKEKERKRKSSSRCVGDLYAFGPTIGSGGFSVVKKCKLKETGKTYAMKIVNRRKMDKVLELALKDEISILNELNYPHIIRLYDTFATINSYYLVTEYLDGGELFDRIVDKIAYTEKEARDVCSIIFGAIKHCHHHRISHRDLKPENLLLRDRENDFDLKIADFGFAKKTPSENSLKTVCGSPGYVSPEILKNNPYGTKTDMWSIGVIIFILLGGYPPFQNAQQRKQFESIKIGEFKFIDKYWGKVTDEAKSLIKSLLCVDPQKRISAEDAMDHPWMQIDPQRLRRSSLFSSIENMREFQYKRKFKSAVQSVMFLNRMSLTTPSSNLNNNENGGEDNYRVVHEGDGRESVTRPSAITSGQ
ncbi:hypothetical protein ACHAXR_007827 [Thalassiosira sp. AJA248-18]